MQAVSQGAVRVLVATRTCGSPDLGQTQVHTVGNLPASRYRTATGWERGSSREYPHLEELRFVGRSVSVCGSVSPQFLIPSRSVTRD